MNERKMGLDILRTLSMCGIVGLHVLGHGGVIESTEASNTLSVWITYFMHNLFFCSVDVFALLTGYLCSEKKRMRSGRLLELWSIVFFYGTIAYVSFLIIRPEVFESFRDYVGYLFPPVIGRMWYITCYSFVFFMIPFLNLFVNCLDKQCFSRFLILLFVLLSVVPTFGLYDYFRTEDGYSPFWLIFCYFVGVYIKKYRICAVIDKKLLMGIFFINNMIVTIWCVFMPWKWILQKYTSPFIVVNAVILLVLLCDVKSCGNWVDRCVCRLSNAAFSVYIIHGTPLFFDEFFTGGFCWMANHGILTGMYICMAVIGVYFAAMVIDIPREKLYASLKCRKRLDKVSDKLHERTRDILVFLRLNK